MTVMEFTADLSQCTREQSTERLFLTGSNVTEDTDVFREDVFSSTEDSDRGDTRWSDTRRIGGDIIDRHFFKFSENGTNLETFFEIVVLIGIDKLDIFTAVEDEGVILIVALSVTEDGIARELNSEFRSAHTVLHDLTVSIDQGRVETSFFAFTKRGFFIEIGDLQIRIRTKKEFGVLSFFLSEFGVPLHRNDEFEFSASHTFEFPIEFVRVSTKHLHDFRIFDAVEKLDCPRIVHETRDGTIECLRTERCPNTSAESILRSGGFEADAVEGKVVDFTLDSILFVFIECGTIESGSFFGEDFGVFDETIPFDGVQLLEVLEEGNTGQLIFFTDDFTERQQDLFAVVRNQDGESRHVIDWSRLGDWRGERLREEGDSSFRFTARREEFGLEGMILLSNEECRGTQCSLAFLFGRNLPLVEKRKIRT